MILILFDIHRNIFSAQCFIQYTTSKSIDNLEISLNKDNVCFIESSNFSSFQQLNITLPTDLFNIRTISSASCQNSTIFTVDSEENFAKWTFSIPEAEENAVEKVFKVNFRLKIMNESVMEKYMSKNCSMLRFKTLMKNEFDASEGYSLICTNCGTLLSKKEIRFQSFYEYHEGTSELSETWFCHKHSNQLHQPNEYVLYIGEVYFYFHSSVINNLILSNSEKEHKCSSCFSVLSLKRTMNHPHYFGFFSDKVMFVASGCSSYNVRKYKTDVALLSFCNIVDDILKISVTCKMYFQSKVEENTECLLLWINSQKVAQYLLHEVNNDDIPKETAFKLKEVYKVLYYACASNADVAKQWKHDFNVEFFQISDNMMKVLRDLLERSSKWGLDHTETINGFSFGYLPACVNVTKCF